MELKDNTAPNLDLSSAFPPTSEWSTLQVTCLPLDYSASAICRAVEDCDAHVLNLNVVPSQGISGLLTIHLRVDHREPLSVSRSLERHGFTVSRTEACAGSEETARLRDRASELLRYLEV